MKIHHGAVSATLLTLLTALPQAPCQDSATAREETRPPMLVAVRGVPTARKPLTLRVQGPPATRFLVLVELGSGDRASARSPELTLTPHTSLPGITGADGSWQHAFSAPEHAATLRFAVVDAAAAQPLKRLRVVEFVTQARTLDVVRTSGPALQARSLGRLRRLDEHGRGRYEAGRGLRRHTRLGRPARHLVP